MLDLNPKSGQTHLLMGMIYEAQNVKDKAADHYREALKIDPGLAVAANNLAWHLCENGGNLDEAMKLAQSAREKLPENPNVADTLGWILYKGGAYRSAIELLEECIKKDSQNAAFAYHLGMSHYKSGNQARAKELLTTALKLDPKLAVPPEALK